MYNYQEASRPQSKPFTDMHRKYRKVWFCFHQIFSSLWKFKMGKWLRECFSWVQYKKASLESCVVPAICAQALLGGAPSAQEQPRGSCGHGTLLVATSCQPPTATEKKFSLCLSLSCYYFTTYNYVSVASKMLSTIYLQRRISVTSWRWRGRKFFTDIRPDTQ